MAACAFRTGIIYIMYILFVVPLPLSGGRPRNMTRMRQQPRATSPSPCKFKKYGCRESVRTHPITWMSSTGNCTSLYEHSDGQLPIDDMQVIGCPDALLAAIFLELAGARWSCPWLLSHPSHAAWTTPRKWLRDYEQYIHNIYDAGFKGISNHCLETL